MQEITPQELKARLDRNDRPLLLDVRQEWETKLCRLDNAVHIPIEDMGMCEALHGVVFHAAMCFLRQRLAGLS